MVRFGLTRFLVWSSVVVLLAREPRAEMSAAAPGRIPVDAAYAIPAVLSGGALVENRGQWPQEILFLAPIAGGLLRVERDRVVLQLYPSATPATGLAVAFTFEGADPWVTIEGEAQQPAIYNFLLGRETTDWSVEVHAFSRVRYRDLYPGIDLLFELISGRVKYSVVAAPGTDVSRLRLQVDGALQVVACDDEEFTVETSAGEIRSAVGRNWEVLDGGATRDVRCVWRLVDDATLGLLVEDRDASRPLVVDPGLTWSTYLGSSYSLFTTGDWASAVAVDGSGDVFVAGKTDGTDFPQTPGTFQAPQGIHDNIFLTRIRGSDGALVFSSVFGGTSASQRPHAIVVSANGRATVVGTTDVSDFPTTPGSFSPNKSSAGGALSGFVTQFTETGASLVFSTYLEGPLYGGQAEAVSEDRRTHSIVVGGRANGPDFPTTLGSFQPTAPGNGGDGFVSRLDPTGSFLEWSTFLGGSSVDDINAVTVDFDGEVLVTGATSSVDFPTTAGAFATQKGLSVNAFVTRLNERGSKLVWSTYLGGSWPAGQDRADAVAIDATGAVVVSGQTTSPNFPITAGAWQGQFPGTFVGFLTRLNPWGSALVYSTFLTGGAITDARGLAVDASGVATVSGGASVFPTTPGAFDVSWNGGADLYVARLSPLGDRAFYSTFVGGPNNEACLALAMTDTGRVTIVGYSVDGYPTTPGAIQPDFSGGQSDGIATTLDLLLQGMESYGMSTPACVGPLAANATQMPAAGASTFSLYCSGAPPLATGWLLIGTASPTSTLSGGAAVWIALNRPWTRIPVTVNSDGYVETVLPLSAGASGKRVSCQYVFKNTPLCPGAGTLSASNGLTITVQ
jgi:hypothetical protein